MIKPLSNRAPKECTELILVQPVTFLSHPQTWISCLKGLHFSPLEHKESRTLGTCLVHEYWHRAMKWWDARERESKSQVFLGTTGDETVRHRNQGVYRSRCEAGRGSGPEELEPRPASAHNSSTQMRFQSKLFGARESPIQTKDRTPEERMSN